MAAGKEIRNQIRSVRNTQKITRAMEMVAASKMRRAQERMRSARPYGERMRAVIGHLHYAHPEYRHPFLAVRPVRRAALIVVTSDRGLCGALNANVLRTALAHLARARQEGIELQFCTIGAKGLAFLKRLGVSVVAHIAGLGDTPHAHDLIGPVAVLLDGYRNGTIDRVDITYNRFVNTMTQQPVAEQLLPLPAVDDPSLRHRWDYLYEPEAQEVLEQLLSRYIETLVYQAVVENAASEQSARMVAMKAASDNAGKMIGDLRLRYNKARQAAITQEISEIVGGAAAV
ncbi:MAG: F0F1 ATP synthase subunit gamma [Acidiferrobacteraceae bacterium]